MKVLKIIIIVLLLVGFTACNTQKSAVAQSQTSVSFDVPKAIEVNGEKLHYIEAGQGEPLIFIHGTVGDYRAWISRMAPYSKDYHVIAYSRRYAWPNKQVFDKNADYSVRIHADDLYALIQKLGFEKVNLLGHSYGAFTALSMALEHPELVNAMVLGEPPAASLLNDDGEGMASFNKFMTENRSAAAQAFINGRNEEGVESFLQGVLGPEFRIADAPPAVRQAWMDNLSEVWGVAMTHWPVTFQMEKFRNLDVPVLLMTGDRSPTWFGAISKELHRLLPKSELVTIKNSSHGLYFENPVDVDKEVKKFLKSH